MSLGESLTSVFNKYATFTGRARRSEYWWFTVCYYAIVFVFNFAQLGMLFQLMSGERSHADPSYTIMLMVGVVVGLGLFLPSLAVTVRRLHDIGKSGWNILWAAIPLIGVIIVLVWMCQDSDAFTNKYGESPKYTNYTNEPNNYNGEHPAPSTLIWIMAFIIVILVVLLCIALGKGCSSPTSQNTHTPFAQPPIEEDSIEEVLDVIDYSEPIEESVSWDVVNNAYVEVLNDLSNDVSECNYFLYDITGDGTPELWIKAGSCEADYMLYVCTYDNGVRKIFETGAGHSGFYSSQNGIIQMCAHMGYSTWYKISYNGKMNITEIFNEDINGTDNDYREPPGQYIEMISFE